MLDHQINRGVLYRRTGGLIFIKGARCFEAKKAINYELGAHSHGGLEEEDGDGKVGGRWPKFQRGKERKC